MVQTVESDTLDKSSNKYIIHINNFDGPLDLLWDLIKKSKMDITEISLSKITEQYLEYVRLMEQQDIQVASEFVAMASELVCYKSKALLPSEELDDEYFVPPLPPDLIQKLLEFKKFQLASRALRDKYDLQTDCLTRVNKLSNISADETYIEVSLFELLKAFVDVIDSTSVIEEEEIIFDELLVSDRIDHIMLLLSDKEFILFTDLFSSRPHRAEVVVSLLAILELAKYGKIKLLQHRIFGTIRILRYILKEEIKE